MKYVLATLLMFASVSGVQAKESATRKTASSSTVINDTVVNMRENEDGVFVTFGKQQGSYLLGHSGAFDNSRKKLQKSLNEKKPASVTVDQNKLIILEVK